MEYVFQDGALKLPYAEALTDGTKASRMLQLWLATPRLSDAERARITDDQASRVGIISVTCGDQWFGICLHSVSAVTYF